jgi:hypothetical protein
MIDLHAARDFKARGQRVLMVLQVPPASILVQTLGRVNRIGQVIPPIVEMHINGMPTEVRFLANMNANLARMNANLASIRKHPLMCEAVPPLLTHDGDVATARVLLANPKIIEDLSIDIPANYLAKLANADGMQTGEEDEDALKGLGQGEGWHTTKAREAGIKSFTRTDNRRIANEVLSRAAILPAAAQSDLLREIQSAYSARVEEREALGLDTTGVKTVDGKVTVRATRLLDIGDGDKPAHEQSAFRAPLRMALVTIEQSVEPLRGKDVVAMVSRAVTKGQDRQLAERTAAFQRIARLAQAAVEEAPRGALAGIDEFQRDRAQHRANVLSGLPIGGGLTARHDGELLEGVIVGYRDHQDDPSFEVALPGLGRTKQVNLSSVIQTSYNHKAWDGLVGQGRRKALRMFDDAGELNKIDTRIAMIGNNWSAVQQDLGKIVTWKNHDQTVTRAVLLPKVTRNYPMAVARFSSVEQYRQVLHRVETGAKFSVSLPLMPWSNGIETAGVSITVQFGSSNERRGVAGYWGQFHISGHTNPSMDSKDRFGLSVSEAHLATFLAAGGGLVQRLYNQKSLEEIQAVFRTLAVERDRLKDAEAIADPAARASARSKARKAAKILDEGVPIRQKCLEITGPNRETVIDDICSMMEQAYDHGLEARRHESAFIDVRSKQIRNWLVQGGRKPEDLDFYTEASPPPQPAAGPAQGAFPDIAPRKNQPEPGLQNAAEQAPAPLHQNGVTYE